MLNVGDGLYRQNNLVPGSSDFTCLVKFTPNNNIAGVDYRTVFAYLDAPPGPTTAYIKFIGIFGALSGGLQKYHLEGNDGSHHISTDFTLVAGTQYNLAYIRKGTDNIFQLNGEEIGRFTADFSSTVWNSAVLGGDGYSSGPGNSVTNENVVFYREYNRALTANEVFTEFQSSKAFDTNVVSDTPLINDGNDISGHSNTWSNISTVGTFINNTLPTVLATVVAPFPYSRVVTQAEFNIANQVYFKYTTTVNTVISSFTNIGGTFTPKIFMYLSDGNTLVNSFSNHPFFRVIGPGDYYFKIVRAAGGASNFDFTTSFTLASLTVGSSVPLNSVLVNDDTSGFPATMWNPDTGALIAVLLQVPGGEMGASLLSGQTLWHDRYRNYRSGHLTILDNNFNFIFELDTTPPLTSAPDICCIASGATNWYVVSNINNHIYKVTKDGVITDTGGILSAFTSAIGINKEETILYWAEGFTSSSIHRYDLVGLAALSDLYTVPGLAGNGFIALTNLDNHNGEIIVLDDSNIVTWYVNTTTNKSFIIHINSNGTLINQYEQTGTYKFVDHINPRNTATLFNVWFYDTSNVKGELSVFNLLTGTRLDNLADIFSTGEGQSSGSFTGATNYFGRSISCVMLTVTFNTSGGIYKIVPGKRNDTLWVTFTPPTTEVVKIPDPFADTGQIGV
jgi:hypothetical protein